MSWPVVLTCVGLREDLNWGMVSTFELTKYMESLGRMSRSLGVKRGRQRAGAEFGGAVSAARGSWCDAEQQQAWSMVGTSSSGGLPPLPAGVPSSEQCTHLKVKGSLRPLKPRSRMRLSTVGKSPT